MLKLHGDILEEISRYLNLEELRTLTIINKEMKYSYFRYIYCRKLNYFDRSIEDLKGSIYLLGKKQEWKKTPVDLLFDYNEGLIPYSKKYKYHTALRYLSEIYKEKVIKEWNGIPYKYNISYKAKISTYSSGFSSDDNYQEWAP